MAANYNSFDDYIKAQESKYPDDRKIGSNATNYASKGRDVIGSEVQWMLDNKDLLSGMNLGKEAMDNLNEFFEKVSSGNVEDKYFGNKWWLDSNKDKFGDTELAAYGYAIMSVNEALRSGQIGMDEYRKTMTTMFSDQFMDSVRAGDFGEFKSAVRMFEMDRDENAIGSNHEYINAPHHDLRNIVNDVDDYFQDATQRHGNDPEHDFAHMYHTNEYYQSYNSGPDYMSSEGFSAMTQMLDDARQKKLITDEQWKNATQKVDEMSTSNWVYHEAGAATMYAMYEAIESGNADLINKVVDPEALENMMIGSNEGVDVFREVEQYADFAAEKNGPSLGTDVDHGDSVTPEGGDGKDEPGDDGKDEPGDDGKDEPGDDDHTIPNDVQDILNSLGVMDGATDTLAAICDDMVIRHFDDPDTGMSFETYQRMANVYDNIKDEHAKETYLAYNPVFADARDYVNRVDEAMDDMCDGFTDGTFNYKENGFFKDPELKEDVQESIQHMIDGDLYEMPDPEAENENDGAGHTDVDASDQLKSSMDFETGKNLAVGIWAGKYGSGNERVEKLTALGYSEDDIKRAQSLVNQGYNFCVNMTEDQFNATMDAYDAKMAENGGESKTLAKGVVDGATIRQEEAAAAEAERQDDDASGTLSDAIADGTEAGTETSADDEMEFIPGPVFGGNCDNPENRETDDKEAEDPAGPEV